MRSTDLEGRCIAVGAPGVQGEEKKAGEKMEAAHIKRAEEQIKNGESQQKLEPPDRDTQPGISGRRLKKTRV